MTFKESQDADLERFDREFFRMLKAACTPNPRDFLNVFENGAKCGNCQHYHDHHNDEGSCNINGLILPWCGTPCQKYKWVNSD